MTLLQALILGIVQGLTEFFPISSSAHLYLAKWFMGIADGEHLLYFDLLCHSGTLLALVLFLREEIMVIFKSPKVAARFILALVPLVPAYFLLQPVRLIASNPAYLGFCLIFTALLLFAATKKKEGIEQPLKVKDVLCIGMMQTIALVPGISRSGSTIAAARFLGWDWVSAARFSFLLSIPAILGGQALETLKLFRETHHIAERISYECYLAGFCASFIMGLLMIRCMFWIYERGKVRPFAWYCLGIGLIALWMLRGH